MIMKVYHYTSKENLDKIINSKLFYPSYLNPQMDTAFGEGWYFTDLDPDTTPNDDLEQQLWMKKESIKSKTYLAFEIDNSLLNYCRPNVYRLKIDAIKNSEAINLNRPYTFTSSGEQAIRYIKYGYKQFVSNQYNY